MDPSSLTVCSDEDLLAAFRQGQREAFGVLVRRYEGELYGYLRRYLGDADLADDVKRLIDNMNLGPVVLAGLSMGGYVAAAFAAAYPKALKAIILSQREEITRLSATE